MMLSTQYGPMIAAGSVKEKTELLVHRDIYSGRINCQPVSYADK
jgi:hypothetical protein